VGGVPAEALVHVAPNPGDLVDLFHQVHLAAGWWRAWSAMPLVMAWRIHQVA